MTVLSHLRHAVDRYLAYRRTRRDLAAVPAEIALEDLGYWPGDADRIARAAVYG